MHLLQCSQDRHHDTNKDMTPAKPERTALQSELTALQSELTKLDKQPSERHSASSNQRCSAPDTQDTSSTAHTQDTSGTAHTQGEGLEEQTANLEEQIANVFYKLVGSNTPGSTQLTAESICCLCGHFERAASTVASSVWQQYYQMHNCLCQLATMRAVCIADWHTHVAGQLLQLPVIECIVNGGIS